MAGSTAAMDARAHWTNFIQVKNSLGEERTLALGNDQRIKLMRRRRRSLFTKERSKDEPEE
jgi:hypothetical protein